MPARKMLLLPAVCLLALTVPALAAAPKTWVWWEGESAAETNLSTDFDFAPRNEQQAAVLSGGEWLGRSETEWSPGYAEYVVGVPEDGKYQFYVRKFWQHGPFRWRFDDQQWQRVARGITILDSAKMRRFVTPSWLKAGTVTLTRGQHRLRIELIEDAKGVAAFDAFVLTRHPFVPRGTLKPGEEYGIAPQGWWAFEPGTDHYAETALLDLSDRNVEDFDAKGFIRIEGDHFVYSRTGEPVRLWAVNGGHGQAAMPRSSIDALAKFLAKRGINCVRLHGGWYYGRGPNATDINPEKVDNAFYLISALKREGIHTALSIHFQHWMNLSESEKFPGYEEMPNGRPYAIHFFHEPYQEVMKSWWRTILTSPNPYTGKVLAEDPGIAYCEVINEDNFFWYSFNPYKNVPARYMADLERQFGEWLAEKYGSIKAAFEAWGPGGDTPRGDHPDEGRVGLYMAWYYTKDAADQRNQQRARDTVEFLARTQRAFFREMRDYIRGELGYGGMVTGSNMGTADAQITAALNYWTYTPTPVNDYHVHWHGAFGKGEGWNMAEGSNYYDRSALRLMDKAGMPEAGVDVPLHGLSYDGRPTINTELSYMLPNRYQPELPGLTAVLGRTAGYDMVTFFSLQNSPGWAASLQGFFPVQTPAVAGQWPAGAILYRSGILREGDLLVREDVSLERLFDLKGTRVVPVSFVDEVGTASAGIDPDEFDALNDWDNFGFNPRAYLLGKVHIYLTEGENDLQVAPGLSELTTGDEHGLKASNGQFHWDTGLGLLRLEAEEAQGALGFLSEAGRVELPDMAVESGLPFGAVLAVGIDERPLAESERILLQVMSEQKNYGFEATPADGERTVQSLGRAPIVVRNIQGVVEFRIPRAAEAKVTALDPNGYALETFAGADHIELRPDVLYYVIER